MRRLLVLLPAVLAVGLAQEHFLDVRALVKETIDAIKEVPAMMQNQSQSVLAAPVSSFSSTSREPSASTVEPTKVAKARSDVYDSLLKLPGDIMSQLARDAGFVDEKNVNNKPEVEENKATEEGRVEKKRDEEESFSFKTVDDMKAEERRQMNELPTHAKKVEDNDDIFSISKLISATGNAIREAQAAQQANGQLPPQPQQEPMITLPPLVPLPPVPLSMPALQLPATVAQPATEIMYRPVTKDGKTVYEQVVVLKEANGSVKLLPNNVVSQLPEAPKKIEIKQVNQPSEAAEFMAPTFPPVVNLFPETSSTEASTTTTEKPEETTTTEDPVKPRRKSLPRRKISYIEKKAKDMHSRQFGAKTVQMNDPIEIQAQEEQEPVNILQKEGNLRVHAINRRRKTRKPRVVKVQEVEKEEEQVEEEPTEEPEEVTEPPKKKKKLTKKVKKEKKEIRKLTDLYDEQWKTQVAPSVSPPSEDFAEQFDGVDEVQEAPKKKEEMQKPQNDTPMSDPIEQRSSKVQMFTKEQEEEVLNKEIHKRVLQRLRLSKRSERTDKTTTTEAPTEAPTDAPTEAPTEAPTDAPTSKAVKEEEEEEVVEEEAGDATDDEEMEEEVEEDDVTTTSTTTTTTEAPVTRAHRIKKNKKRPVVTRHQCLNLRSFARQFQFDTIEDFSNDHCYFIENYYPALTCARSKIYVAKCAKLLRNDE